MREILFRAKRADNGEWIEGELIHSIYNINDTCVGKFGCDLGFYQVIPETVGQYTGLTDKNGTKIFEGDILEFTNCDDKKTLHLVFYDEYFATWQIAENGDADVRDFISGLDSNRFEVIGNIYDNPELLEQGV